MKHATEDYNKRIVDLENKIPADEPVFLLRGQDAFAPKLLLQWAMELRLNNGDPELAHCIEVHAQRMIDWQKLHGKKTPDMYKSSPEKLIIKDKIEKILSSENLKNEVKELQKLVDDYYNKDSYALVIFLTSDLKHKGIGINYVTLDDIEVNDVFKLTRSHIIILLHEGKTKVLKADL